MRIAVIARLLLVCSTLGLAACQAMDPYTRSDMWQPTGSNQGNLAAMVANPYDLIRGRGLPAADANEPTLAINRLWTDTPKPLLDPGGAGSGGGSTSGGAGSGSGSGSGSGGGSGAGSGGGGGGSGSGGS